MKKLLLVLAISLFIYSCSEKIYLYGTPIKAIDVVGVKEFNPPNQHSYSPLIDDIPIIVKNRYENIGKLVDNIIREPIDFINSTKWKNSESDLDSLNYEYFKNYIYYNLNEFELSKEDKDSIKNTLYMLKNINNPKTYKDSLYLDKNYYVKDILYNQLLFLSYPVAFKITDVLKRTIKSDIDIKGEMTKSLKGNIDADIFARIERTFDRTNIVKGQFYNVALNPIYEDKLRLYLKKSPNSSLNKKINSFKCVNKKKAYLISSAVVLDLSINYNSIEKKLDSIKSTLKAEMNNAEFLKIKSKIDLSYNNLRTITTKTDLEKIFLIKYGYNSRIQNLINKSKCDN